MPNPPTVGGEPLSWPHAVAKLRSAKSQEKACAGKFYQERCIQLRWLASCNCQSSLKGEDDRMSIFPTKILFATDGSRDAEVAATAAVGLARATSSELHVVTAAEEYPHYEAYWPLAQRSRQLAQEILHKQLKRIEKLGGTVDQNYLRIEEQQPRRWLA
jgi:hypothetical protein